MRSTRRHKTSLFLRAQTLAGAAALLLATLFPASRAHAQTDAFWTTGSGTWSTASNWSGNTLPTDSTTAYRAVFTGSTGGTVSVSANRSIAGIYFSNTTSTYTISGSAVSTLTIGATGINNADDNNQVFASSNLTVALAANQTFAASGAGNLTFNNRAIAVGGNVLTLSASSSGTGSINANMTGTSGANIVKTGSGIWILSGNNSAYNGGISVNAGTLRATGNTTALGNGTVTLGGGTLDLMYNSNTTLGRNVTLTASSNISSSRTSNGTGAVLTLGTLAMGSGTTLTISSGNGVVTGGTMVFGNVTMDGTGTLSIAGTSMQVGGILGNGSLVKQGLGTLTINGASTNTAGTNIFNGTVALGTSGSLSSNGAVQINPGGSLILNNSAQTIGTLVGSGNVVLGSNTLTVNHSGIGTYQGNISGTGSSSALVKAGSGTLTLSGTNTYTGGTTVVDGTLILNGASALSTNSTLNISGGNVGFTNSTSIIGLSGTGGTLSLSSGSTFSILQSGNSTYSGNITGAGGIIKGGTGTLTLAGTSNYSGGTLMGNGTLIVASGGTLAGGELAMYAGNLTFNNAAQTIGNLTGFGGTIMLGAGNTLTVNQTGGTGNYSATITGAGALVKTGASTLYLSGTSNYTGGTTLVNGNLIVNSIASTGNVTINGGTLLIGGQTIGTFSGSGGTLSQNTLTINQGSNATYSGAVTGGGMLIKTGTETLTLAGTNTYTGGTRIESGGLVLQNGLNSNATVQMAGAGGTLTLNNPSQTFGSLTGNGTVSLSSATTLTLAGASNQTFAGVIAGGGALVKAGTQNITLGGVNTNTGGTTIGNGTLYVASTGALGNGNVTLGGGNLTMNNAAQTIGNLIGYSGSLALNGTTLTVTQTSDQYLSSNVTGAGALVKDGASTLTLGGTLGYSGGTTVNAGMLATNYGTSLASGSNLTVNGGTMLFGNPGQTIGQLSGTGGTVSFSAGPLTINQSSNSTYSGSFAGTGNLTRLGSGTLTLGGDSTGFTGAVRLMEGRTIVASNNAFGASSSGAGVTVDNGATLQIDGGRLNTSNGDLSLTGTGVALSGNTAGALYSTGGNNRWNGTINITGNTLIKTQSTGYLALGNTSTTYNRGNETGNVTDTHTLNIGSNTLTLAGNSTAGVAMYINSRITGNGSMVIDMDAADDVVRLTANTNTFTGTTTINKGTLSLATLYNTVPGDPVHPNYFGINGPVVIGNNSDASGSAILSVQAGTLYSELMNYNTAVTLNKSGVWNQLATQSIGTINFSGGKIDLGETGGIALGTIVGSGNSTPVGGTINVLASNQTAYITGNLTGNYTNFLDLTVHKTNATLSNTFATFNVTGTGNFNRSDLTVDTKIYHGGLTLNGNGTLTFTNNNAYELQTTINGGVLSIQANTALGEGGTLASSTQVNTNGTLQMFSNSTIGDLSVDTEQLRLNGEGYTANAGALQNLAGNNTWRGGIDLESNSRISSVAGLLTIANSSITSSNNSNLTVSGAGNTTISAAIATNNGGVLKEGSGTLVLSGSNTYHGNTTISQGVISAQSANALGSGTSGTYVTSTGELQINNTAVGGSGFTVNAEPTFTTGNGTSGAGAVRNVAGNNTYMGLITATGNSLITSNTGLTFTLSGGTASSGATMTFGATGYTGNLTISGNMANSAAEVVKAGSGNLALTGSAANIGKVSLNAGTMTVGGTTTLTTKEIDTAVGTTLTMASGGQITINALAGTESTINGTMQGSAGTMTFNGVDTTSVLKFDSSVSWDATAMTLELNGGRVVFTGGVGYTFGTIKFGAGNTILDFNGLGGGGEVGTWLSSANLELAAGATVTVINWASVADNAAQSTIWYLQSNTTAHTGGTLVGNGTGNISLGGSDRLGQVPLNQITFQDYNGMTTTWVSGNHSGWFNHEIRPTPEPSTYGAIFVSGMLSLVGYRRWRRGKKQD